MTEEIKKKKDKSSEDKIEKESLQKDENSKVVEVEDSGQTTGETEKEETLPKMITIPVSEYEFLKKSSEKQCEYFEGWQRERADFINYKKRLEREQAGLKDFLSGEIVKKYLVVLDDIELAIKNKPKDGDFKGWDEGIDLIYQKLLKILEEEGVKKIPTEGEQFNPKVHEALTQIESPEKESGEIIEVIRQGYLIGDRVLRPAIVVIAK